MLQNYKACKRPHEPNRSRVLTTACDGVQYPGQNCFHMLLHPSVSEDAFFCQSSEPLPNGSLHLCSFRTGALSISNLSPGTPPPRFGILATLATETFKESAPRLLEMPRISQHHAKSREAECKAGTPAHFHSSPGTPAALLQGECAGSVLPPGSQYLSLLHATLLTAAAWIGEMFRLLLLLASASPSARPVTSSSTRGTWYYYEVVVAEADVGD